MLTDTHHDPREKKKRGGNLQLHLNLRRRKPVLKAKDTSIIHPPFVSPLRKRSELEIRKDLAEQLKEILTAQAKRWGMGTTSTQE